ncbi:DUF397 domain-containing protein [Streptomyces sp. MS19]|uniref:DUF397 domain-containing protein n=1 Tax=Streptomyces sp. MS19 TaxID=3385972 RepID=UPI0039A2E973
MTHPATTSADLSTAEWFKSSFSNADNECVEIAHLDSRTAIRDSKTGADDSPVLVLAAGAFASFINSVSGTGQPPTTSA